MFRRLIRLGERLDAEVGGREARHHALPPKRLAHPFGDLRARAVVAEERQAQILPKLRAIGLDAGAYFVEHVDRRAARISRCLQHQRRDGADQHDLGHALRTMPSDIARDFAAAGGMADMDRVCEIQLLSELGEVVGVRVHVVAVPRLARTSVAAAVVRDAAVSARGQKEHLVFKGIRGKRPAVTEDNGLSATPVVVIDLRAVFRRDGVHRVCSFAGVGGDIRTGLLGRCGHRHRREACGSGHAGASEQNATTGNKA